MVPVTVTGFPALSIEVERDICGGVKDRTLKKLTGITVFVPKTAHTVNGPSPELAGQRNQPLKEPSSSVPGCAFCTTLQLELLPNPNVTRVPSGGMNQPEPLTATTVPAGPAEGLLLMLGTALLVANVGETYITTR